MFAFVQLTQLLHKFCACSLKTAHLIWHNETYSFSAFKFSIGVFSKKMWNRIPNCLISLHCDYTGFLLKSINMFLKPNLVKRNSTIDFLVKVSTSLTQYGVLSIRLLFCLSVCLFQITSRCHTMSPVVVQRRYTTSDSTNFTPVLVQQLSLQ